VFCALSEAFSPECRDRWRVRRRGTAIPHQSAPIRLANGRTGLRTQLDARNRADRATFICHKRRCGKAYPARWEKLDAAFRRALAEVGTGCACILACALARLRRCADATCRQAP
jgi:hypothetical protein